MSLLPRSARYFQLRPIRTGEIRLPEEKHVRGVGEKEQRQSEHIKEEAEKEGRYRGREKEVAVRTVLKQHKEKGHKQGE